MQVNACCKLTILILSALLVFGLLSAGLAKEQPKPSLAGKWNSQWGKIVFKVDGKNVTGEFAHGKGHIEGTLTEDGKTFTAKWTNATARKPGERSGSMLVVMSDDGKTLAGHYWYGKDTIAVGKDWKATRIK